MKKKQYIQPCIEVVTLCIKDAILSISGGDPQEDKLELQFWNDVYVDEQY